MEYYICSATYVVIHKKVTKDVYLKEIQDRMDSEKPFCINYLAGYGYVLY